MTDNKLIIYTAVIFTYYYHIISILQF